MFKFNVRKMLIILLCLMLFGVASSGFAAADKKDYTIGLYCHHIVPPWLVLQNAARMRAEEISKEFGVNIKLDIQYPSLVTDISRQMKIIDDYIAKKVDMIVAIPITTSSFDVVCKKAYAAGIPLGAFITEQEAPDDGKIEWWLYNDDREGGYMLGKALAEKMNGKGNIVLLQGVYECIWNKNRAVGVYDVLKEYPEMRMLVDDTANWTRIDAIPLMEDIITRYGKKIGGVVGLNDEMAIGARIALDTAEINIPIVGWDGTEFSTKAILDGSLDYSIDMHWAAMGSQIVDLAWQTMQGTSVKPKRNILKTTLIDKPYAEKLLQEIIDTKDMKKPADWESMKLSNYRKEVLKLKLGEYTE